MLSRLRIICVVVLKKIRDCRVNTTLSLSADKQGLVCDPISSPNLAVWLDRSSCTSKVWFVTADDATRAVHVTPHCAVTRRRPGSSVTSVLTSTVMTTGTAVTSLLLLLMMMMMMMMMETTSLWRPDTTLSRSPAPTTSSTPNWRLAPHPQVRSDEQTPTSLYSHSPPSCFRINIYFSSTCILYYAQSRHSLTWNCGDGRMGTVFKGTGADGVQFLSSCRHLLLLLKVPCRRWQRWRPCHARAVCLLSPWWAGLGWRYPPKMYTGCRHLLCNYLWVIIYNYLSNRQTYTLWCWWYHSNEIWQEQNRCRVISQTERHAKWWQQTAGKGGLRTAEDRKRKLVDTSHEGIVDTSSGIKVGGNWLHTRQRRY